MYVYGMDMRNRAVLIKTKLFRCSLQNSSPAEYLLSIYEKGEIVEREYNSGVFDMDV